MEYLHKNKERFNKDELQPREMHKYREYQGLVEKYFDPLTSPIKSSSKTNVFKTTPEYIHQPQINHSQKRKSKTKKENNEH